MKIFSAIKGFVTTKKVASAVIGVAMIGTASAAGIVAGSHPNVVASIASSTTASSSAVSSASSSKTSSSTSSAALAVASSAPASSVSSAAGTSSTPAQTSSTSDKTSAMAAEDTRHQNAVASINANYDPQISTLQNEIATYQTEGARDTTSEIAALQAEYTEKQNAYYTYYRQNSAAPGMADSIKLYYDNMIWAGNNLTNKKPQLEKLNSDYQKEQSDQSQLANLQSQKQSAVDNETADHNSKINEINVIFA